MQQFSYYFLTVDLKYEYRSSLNAKSVKVVATYNNFAWTGKERGESFAGDKRPTLSSEKDTSAFWKKSFVGFR